MDNKNYSAPIMISTLYDSQDQFDYLTYLDTYSNAIISSRQYRGDPFLCIFHCTPKNPEMKKFFSNPNIPKKIVLPNHENMVIDPSGMAVGNTDIILPWSQYEHPHLIVEPSSFVSKQMPVTGTVNVNFIVPEDVVMIYLDEVEDNDQIVRRPTLMFTTYEHAKQIRTVSGQPAEVIQALNMNGVQIQIDRSKMLLPVIKDGKPSFEITDISNLLETVSVESQTTFFS